MSMVGTLAKVAVAVVAAKGIGHVLGRINQPASAAGTDPHNGSLGNGQRGVGTILEQLPPSAGEAGSRTSASTRAGSLDALTRGLGGVSGSSTTGAGGKPQREGSFADVLNQSFQKSGEPKIPPTPQQDAVAGLMLRALLQAAKCDGKIDAGEKAKMMKALGEASQDDIAFVTRELSSPVDVAGLVKQVPKGLESQIYAVSLMGIDLDSQQEAEYLAALASALGIGAQEANAIHAKLGKPALFS
jgi:uncharacterized membrane protein YebE (DUF533 family)